MDNSFYKIIEKRIGKKYLKKRLKIQQKRKGSNKFYLKGTYFSFHLERIGFVSEILKFLLKFIRRYDDGIKNTLAYEVKHEKIKIKNLPKQFKGFRILQLSDMHADAIPDKGKKLIEVLKKIEVDICVFTGDYRHRLQDSYRLALNITKNTIENINAKYGILGILGNHDYIEFVYDLEKLGIKMLLNEAVSIDINGKKIWISGIDDNHSYDCGDVRKAISNIPEKDIKILLSHTPESYKKAKYCNIDYVICGHTHGGQICLPGGIPIVTNIKGPRKFCTGPWSYKKMRGYTSKGVGSTGLPVRFFCPPEITIHELE